MAVDVTGWIPNTLGPLELQANGLVISPARPKLNFVGLGITVEDDADNDATKVEILTSSTPTGTGLRKVVSGTESAAAALLVNADVDAAAAIAGSKISPDFSTATVRAKKLRLGTTTIATTGNIDALDSSGASIVRLTGAGAVNVRGILAGNDGDVLYLHNRTGGSTVTLVHDSGAVADLTRRYDDAGSADYPFVTGIVQLYYDGAASRWVRMNYM